jgi:CBS domain containing-hemolysin-like protein
VLIALAVFLLLLNGFFVAAEFALVKVRPSQLEVLVAEGRRFAKTAQWLSDHLDAALGACQLGITIASLGLGWVGEPAVARLLRPLFVAAGIESEAVIHGVSLAVGFTVITALHLVVGELAPKALAIRRAEGTALACSVPLRWFYLTFYPFLVVLNGAALGLIRIFGIESAGSHHGEHSEEELRALLARAQIAGELSRSEHELLHAVFEFDDLICRHVMLPRGDVDFIRLDAPYDEWMQMVRHTKHTRYPICDGSLDKSIGIVHIKDLLALDPAAADALTGVMRRPHFVPETMPMSRLLRYFQAIRQHFALVVNEFGTVTGIVTLENVLEQIVGRVEDEFDLEAPDVIPTGSNTFLVDGRVLLETVERALKVSLAPEDRDVDTLSGLLVDKLGRIVQAGDTIDLAEVSAEVLDVKGARARQVRLTLKRKATAASAAETAAAEPDGD